MAKFTPLVLTILVALASASPVAQPSISSQPQLLRRSACTYTPYTPSTPFKLAAYSASSETPTYLSASRVNVISPYPDAYLLHNSAFDSASEFTYDASSHALRTILAKSGGDWAYNSVPLAQGQLLTFRAGDGNAPPASVIAPLRAEGCEAAGDVVLGDAGSREEGSTWSLCSHGASERHLFYGRAADEGCEPVTLKLIW